MRKKKVLIIGINSQDGSYLADLLFQKDYLVYGTTRDMNTLTPQWNTKNKVDLIQINYSNAKSITKKIKDIMPDEIYNFAALSTGEGMYRNVDEIYHLNGFFVSYILEAIRLHNKNIKFFQASSREVFGIPQEFPQNEKTRFLPRSPYGVAKLFSQNITRIYREYYNLFSVSGILFNHESFRRGDSFVSKKICKAAAKIKYGSQDKLYLGDLDSTRDWGFAGDFVKAMWMMLQSENPKDYVIATGKEHSIRDLCIHAFSFFDLNYEDYVIEDKGIINREKVKVNFIGDASKINYDLGWEIKKNFKDMVYEMVKYEYEKEITINGI
jgi:GDPmannose 4,6-dehydratase